MDFFVERVIHVDAAEAAKIMFDHELETQWVEHAGKPESLTPGPFAVGSRIRHHNSVLGVDSSYVTEVTALDPGRRLEMRIIEGPLHGDLIYQVAPTAGGSIASIHLRDAKSVIPRSTWLRKHQAEENLERLALLVNRLHS